MLRVPIGVDVEVVNPWRTSTWRTRARPQRAVEIIEAGAEPLKDLFAALHTKLLIEEVERSR